MKNKFSFSFLGAIAAVALLLICGGCDTLDKGYRQEVVEHPGAPVATNTIYVTNWIVAASPVFGLTNAPVPDEAAADLISKKDPEAVVKKVVKENIEIITGPPTYTTNLVNRREVELAANVASAIPGYGAAIGAGLLALYNGYRNVRNKKSATAVIQGIQDARELLHTLPQGAAIDAQVKELLIKAQLDHGVVDDVKKLLDSHFGDHEGPGRGTNV